MKDINEQLKTNELIAKKFSKIASTLAVYHYPRGLFTSLILRLQREFEIPYVWLTIIKEPETARLIDHLQCSEVLADRLNLMARDSFYELIQKDTKPVIANTNLRPYYRLLPPKIKYFIKSICVAPITCHGQVVGSINYGDSSPLRYQPGMDARLLTGLMQRVSNQLSRTVNVVIDDQRAGG